MALKWSRLKSTSMINCMASAKSQAANQRNAQHSSGPKTDEGKRRSAVNAMRHGLTVSIESSAWAHHLQSLETLLESDGLNQPEARDLALCILNYERNAEYQRERYLKSECSKEEQMWAAPCNMQRELRNANRHLKRAANQLTSQCKDWSA